MDFVYTVAIRTRTIKGWQHNKCQIPKYFFHFVAYKYLRLEWMLWKTTALKSTSAVFVTVLFKQRYDFWYFNDKVQVHWKYCNKSLWAGISWEHIDHPVKRWIKLSCMWDEAPIQSKLIKTTEQQFAVALFVKLQQSAFSLRVSE